MLHLLYARFWHKVLYDLGYVSSFEPFRRLFNQGMIQAYAFVDPRGAYVPAEEVVEVDGRWFHGETEVRREYGKMGKSLKNVVTPDEMVDQYGADTFRVYEMAMGPLDVSRPWDTRAVVGSQRFLQRVWRLVIDEETGAVRVTDEPLDTRTRRLLHRTIDGVRTDMDELRFNTAIAKLIELNNRVTKLDSTPREVAEALVLMVAPLAPHVAEELWRKLGHDGTITYVEFPVADPQFLTDETIEAHLVVSKWGARTLQHETGWALKDVHALAHTAYHANDEGALVDFVEERDDFDAFPINPGGLWAFGEPTRIALEQTGKPVVEVHFANIRATGEHSVLTSSSDGTVMGFRHHGYLGALVALTLQLDAT